MLGTGLVGVAALLLAAILVGGSPAGESSQDSAQADAGDRATEKASASGKPKILTGEEALRQDARWYARDMGVSLDEAIRRLEMQDDKLPAELERELKENEKETFAGLWLRHEPDYGLTIATSGDPEAMMQKIEPIVARTPWEGTVNVRRVEASEAQLNAARAEAERMLDRLGITYGSGDNIMKNRIGIDVEDKGKVVRRLSAAGRQLPEHVVLTERWVTLQVTPQ